LPKVFVDDEVVVDAVGSLLLLPPLASREDDGAIACVACGAKRVRGAAEEALEEATTRLPLFGGGEEDDAG